MTRAEIVAMVERMVALGLTPDEIAFFIRAALL